MRPQNSPIIVCFFAITMLGGFIRAGEPTPRQIMGQTMAVEEPSGPAIVIAPVPDTTSRCPAGSNPDCAARQLAHPVAYRLAAQLAPSRPWRNPCPCGFKIEWMFIFSSSREFFGDPCLKQPPRTVNWPD